MKNILNFISKIIKSFTQLVDSPEKYKPAYRLLDVQQDNNGDYKLHIQIINQNRTFYSKPEELLADDNLVDRFSPRDVRSITYLGYLGINSPKYKILAQRLVGDHKVTFVIKKKGEKDYIIKTASEILNQNLISKMKPEDAHKIGYSAAAENIHNDRNQLNEIKKSLLEKIE